MVSFLFGLRCLRHRNPSGVLIPLRARLGIFYSFFSVAYTLWGMPYALKAMGIAMFWIAYLCKIDFVNQYEVNPNIRSKIPKLPLIVGNLLLAVSGIVLMAIREP